jgi:type II secretory pathway component PulF
MRFDYVAYTLGQGVVKGQVEAENELEARQEILQQG